MTDPQHDPIDPRPVTSEAAEPSPALAAEPQAEPAADENDAPTGAAVASSDVDEPDARPEPTSDEATTTDEPDARPEPTSDEATTTDEPDARPEPVAGPESIADMPATVSDVDRLEPAATPATDEPAARTDADEPHVPLEPTGEPEAVPAPEPPSMVRRTVSQEIARQLAAAGARYCFTVPAEPILPLLDDLAEAGIRVVTTRHEGGAAFMAEALSQATARPQIVAVSRAVGAANAAVGIHAAQQDSAPLVALVGQVRSTLLGREAFQEADLATGVGSLAAWSSEIGAADQVEAILGKAWRRLNTGRPGPVLLSVPADIQLEQVDLPDEEPPRPPGARGAAADRSAVSRAMKLLAASERGVIVAGAGVLRARATKRLVAVSEALAVPVIAAWRRPDVFPNDHANYLGMAGPWAAPTVNGRLADADVIMFIGTRLSEMTTNGYAIPGPATRWIHVDVEPRVKHAGLEAPTIPIAADASRFLDTAWSDLRAVALDAEMRSRREARTAADREAYRAACEVAQGEWSGPGAHPGRVLATLRQALPDNATIATDAGNLAAFAARGYAFRRAGTFLGATSGTMGFGLPAAIAASLMDPDRIAVALCGDGGFATSMNEIETAVREGAHPIAIVFDNQRYGSIAVRQLLESRPTRSTELGPVDFAAIARAQGALGFTVDSDAAFEPALREAITSRQTSVIHVTVDRAWLSVDDNPLATSRG